ncbi:MAG TPA: hypothetical protein VHL09_17350, partial [Dehalococcoidia bacterium]|nr:hypothetical protein [Dehalococcoidia bacterium]
GVLVYGVWLLRQRPLTWAALLPGLLAIGAIFGPFWLADPVATRYNLLGYHVDDTSWLETLRRTAPYWVNFLPGYLAWTFIGPILLIAAWRSGWRPYRRDGHECAVCWLLGLTVLATTILHALPENPQAKYQTLIAPWASVLVGAGLVQLARRSGWTWAFRPRTAIVLVALPLGLQVAGNLALAAVQGGLSPRFSEIDVADGRLPIAEIEDIGRVVRDGTPPGQPVITLFTSVAVAADRPVLPGLEMSIFALTGSAEQADRLRLMTPDQLVSAIRSGAGSAVIAERDLRAIVPESVILDRYCPAAYFDQIGQFRDAVEVYLLRAGGRCP